MLDAVHVRLLLAYLAEVADGRGDEAQAQFCRSWERRLGRIEAPMRRAAQAEGADPDRAVLPIDDSAPGRAAHGLAYAVGSVGEWVDGRVARKR